MSELPPITREEFDALTPDQKVELTFEMLHRLAEGWNQLNQTFKTIHDFIDQQQHTLALVTELQNAQRQLAEKLDGLVADYERKAEIVVRMMRQLFAQDN